MRGWWNGRGRKPRNPHPSTVPAFHCAAVLSERPIDRGRKRDKQHSRKVSEAFFVAGRESVGMQDLLPGIDASETEVEEEPAAYLSLYNNITHRVTLPGSVVFPTRVVSNTCLQIKRSLP